MSIAHTLNEEFRRVAKEEDITLEQLTEEIASATNYTTRQLYNFRSGKWPIPSELIPYFVMRFKSRAVLNALIGLCDSVPVEVPEQYNLAKLSSDAVRSTLVYYEQNLSAFDDGKISRNELNELRESGERARTMIAMFESITFTAYEAQHPGETVSSLVFSDRGKEHRSTRAE